MVPKIQPRDLIWVPSSTPRAGHLSEKNDDLAVQYEDCPWISQKFLSFALLLNERKFKLERMIVSVQKLQRRDIFSSANNQVTFHSCHFLHR